MTSYRTCTQPAKVCFHRGPQPTYADPACHLSAVEIVEDVPERPLQRPQIKRSGSMKHALSCQGAQDQQQRLRQQQMLRQQQQNRVFFAAGGQRPAASMQRMRSNLSKELRRRSEVSKAWTISTEQWGRWQPGHFFLDIDSNTGWWWFGTFFIFFAYIGKNSPNWRTPSPPTRNRFCKISF